MPVNPASFTHKHIILPSNYTETEKYKSAKNGFSQEFRLYPRDRQAHHDLLELQFRAMEKEIAESATHREAMGISGFNGITVTFKSEPDYKLKHESLDLTKSGIELLNVQTIGTETFATVFIPDGKIQLFLKKLEQYVSVKHTNSKLFDNIAEIKKAAVEGLWTDESTLLPSGDQPIWWEVWLRAGESREQILSLFRTEATTIGLRIDKNKLLFLDRTVVLAYGTKLQMAESIDLLNCIAELRKAKESPALFLDMARITQQEWIDDTVRRLAGPGLNDVSILLLDTGVTRAHPLISRFLDETDLHAYRTDWVRADENGHGTAMAGLALYGDLMKAVTSNEAISINHRIESGKIIRNEDTIHDPELYGAVTSEVVSMAEIQAPQRKRIISMAIATRDFRDRGKPSSWSAAIDQLSSGAIEEDRPKRLIIVCAGNVETIDRICYPDSNMSDGIHDPAQAWNSLCVGAYTQKTTIDTNKYPGLEPLANAGNINPASTTSMIWQKQWPLKPDVVFEGGNWAKDHTNCVIGGDPDEIRLLTTNNNYQANHFTVTGDTSAATAQVARIAAVIQNEYPDYWPETIRGLIVHSAEWTPAMLQQWNMFPLPTVTNKHNVQNLIRYCGFGVPDSTRGLRCAENNLTLILQSALNPFEKGATSMEMKDMNLHTIPWPVETLRELQNTPIEMRVTLSYFIEPNPGERGWQHRHRYQSHGLRFDMNLPTETKDRFRMFLNKAAREEEENPSIQTSRDGEKWIVGSSLRHKGSIHSDIWRGTAIELAERRYIGVYPVIGWWREATKHKRWDKQARYSLIVSIATPAESVNLYTEIANEIGIVIST